MKLLVIGAGGFIGRAVSEHFDQAGWLVGGVGRTLPDVPARGDGFWREMRLPDAGLAALLREWRPTLLVYAAGTALVAKSVEQPLADFEQSVAVWASVLEAVRISGIACRIVFLSSAAVYGNPARLPIAETHQSAPVSPYGYHKQMCEALSEYYARLYGVPVCSLRVFSAYGPGLRRQVLWEICRKVLTYSRVELMGTGDETRDFVHVADVARAIEVVAERGNFAAGVYNVASGTSTTIRDAAEKLVLALGRSVPVQFNGEVRPGDPLYWRADLARLSALGWAARMPFDDGLAAFARWAGAELPDRRPDRS
jgi:UDP-glucose 4-epimerase